MGEGGEREGRRRAELIKEERAATITKTALVVMFWTRSGRSQINFELIGQGFNRRDTLSDDHSGIEEF